MSLPPPPLPSPPALPLSSSSPQAAMNAPPMPAAAAPCRKPRRVSTSLRCCLFMCPPLGTSLAMDGDGGGAPSRVRVLEHPPDALGLRRAHVGGGFDHHPPGGLVEAPGRPPHGGPGPSR